MRKPRLPLLLAIVCASCGAQRYAVDRNGRIADSAIGTYTHDGKGLSLYFTNRRIRHGFRPLDREARRILSLLDIDPKTDTILFTGCGFLCIERRSAPSYARSEAKSPAWLKPVPVLDTNDLQPSGYIPEEHFIFKQEKIRRDFSPESVELLCTATFTRKVTAFPRRRTVLTEHLIPYKGHRISLGLVDRTWSGRHSRSYRRKEGDAASTRPRPTGWPAGDPVGGPIST